MFADYHVRVRTSTTLVIEMPGLSPSPMRLEDIQALKAAFGERLQEHIPLERFTAVRIGGPADFLLEVTSADRAGRCGFAPVGFGFAIYCPWRWLECAGERCRCARSCNPQPGAPGTLRRAS